MSQLLLIILLLGSVSVVRPPIAPLEVVAIEAKEVEAKVRAPLLELRLVHPENYLLIRKIDANESKVPRGYEIKKLPIIDRDTNKKVGEEAILVEKKSLITAEHLEMVFPTGQLGEIAVRLTVIGGKKVIKATQEMEKGRNQIAVLFEGEALIAPVVNDNLSRSFVINGLDGKAEVDRIVHALNASIK